MMSKIQKYGLVVLGMAVGLTFFLLAAVIDLLFHTFGSVEVMLLSLFVYPILGIVIAMYVGLESNFGVAK